MDKIYVVFWTQGGNTQAMAEAIGEGIREAGKEAEVVFVTGANLDELKAAPKALPATEFDRSRKFSCAASPARFTPDAEYTNFFRYQPILSS